MVKKEGQENINSKLLQIIDYTPDYKQVFKDLNKEWIDAYFKMEEADYIALDNPEEYIINKGGFILIAKYQDETAGVCALIKLENRKHEFELAKMAVSPKFQGFGIGHILGKAVIQRAKEQKAKYLYLESNTILKPAINLYYKLGFIKIQGPQSPYERSNIHMELEL